MYKLGLKNGKANVDEYFRSGPRKTSSPTATSTKVTCSTGLITLAGGILGSGVLAIVLTSAL